MDDEFGCHRELLTLKRNCLPWRCEHDSNFPDTLFICSDGQVRAHRAVLSCYSILLRDIFLDLEYKEGEINDFSVMLPDVSMQDLLHFLQIVYKEEVEKVVPSELLSLLNISILNSSKDKLSFSPENIFTATSSDQNVESIVINQNNDNKSKQINQANKSEIKTLDDISREPKKLSNTNDAKVDDKLSKEICSSVRMDVVADVVISMICEVAAEVFHATKNEEVKSGDTTESQIETTDISVSDVVPTPVPEAASSDDMANVESCEIESTDFTSDSSLSIAGEVTVDLTDQFQIDSRLENSSISPSHSQGIVETTEVVYGHESVANVAVLEEVVECPNHHETSNPVDLAVQSDEAETVPDGYAYDNHLVHSTHQDEHFYIGEIGAETTVVVTETDGDPTGACQVIGLDLDSAVADNGLIDTVVEEEVQYSSAANAESINHCTDSVASMPANQFSDGDVDNLPQECVQECGPPVDAYQSMALADVNGICVEIIPDSDFEKLSEASESEDLPGMFSYVSNKNQREVHIDTVSANNELLVPSVPFSSENVFDKDFGNMDEETSRAVSSISCSGIEQEISQKGDDLLGSALQHSAPEVLLSSANSSLLLEQQQQDLSEGSLAYLDDDGGHHMSTTVGAQDFEHNDVVTESVFYLEDGNMMDCGVDNSLPMHQDMINVCHQDDFDMNGYQVEDEQTGAESSFEIINGIRCQDCDKTFVTSEELGLHQLAAHSTVVKTIENTDFDISVMENTQPTCLLCGQMFDTSQQLTEHTNQSHPTSQVNVVLNEILVKCGSCDMSFNNPALLERHIRREHQSRSVECTFSCSYCKIPVDIPTMKTNFHFLNRHPTMPMGRARYTCNLCEFEVESSKIARMHKARHSKDQKLYKCGYCDSGFKSVGFLTRHLKLSHNVNLPSVYAFQAAAEKIIMREKVNKVIKIQKKGHTSSSKQKFSMKETRKELLPSGTTFSYVTYVQEDGVTPHKGRKRASSTPEVVDLEPQVPREKRKRMPKTPSKDFVYEIEDIVTDEDDDDYDAEKDAGDNADDHVIEDCDDFGDRFDVKELLGFDNNTGKEIISNVEPGTSGEVTEFKFEELLDSDVGDEVKTRDESETGTAKKELEQVCDQEKTGETDILQNEEKQVSGNQSVTSTSDTKNSKVKRKLKKDPSERLFPCGICNKSYTNGGHLRDHIIVSHTKEYPFRCKVCGRGFLRPGQFNHHMEQQCTARTQKSVKPRSSNAVIQSTEKEERVPPKIQTPSDNVSTTAGKSCAQEQVETAAVVGGESCDDVVTPRRLFVHVVRLSAKTLEQYLNVYSCFYCDLSWTNFHMFVQHCKLNHVEDHHQGSDETSVSENEGLKRKKSSQHFSESKKLKVDSSVTSVAVPECKNNEASSSRRSYSHSQKEMDSRAEMTYLSEATEGEQNQPQNSEQVSSKKIEEITSEQNAPDTQDSDGAVSSLHEGHADGGHTDLTDEQQAEIKRKMERLKVRVMVSKSKECQKIYQEVFLDGKEPEISGKNLTE